MTRAERRYPPGRYYSRVALGTLVPGAGLLRTRWRVLGWVLVSAVLALVAGLAWSFIQGGIVRTVLDAAVNTRTLKIIGVVVMVGAVLWVGSIVLTAQQLWPRVREGRILRVAFATLMCLLVAAPSVVAVRYLDVQSGLAAPPAR